jgi:hypothetical protein
VKTKEGPSKNLKPGKIPGGKGPGGDGGPSGPDGNNVDIKDILNRARDPDGDSEFFQP